MTSPRLLFLLGLGIAAGQPALAQDTQAWIGAPDCRLAAVRPAPAQAPAWKGSCKDGYADGKGVLEWRNKDGKTYRLSGVFAGGQVQGDAELRYPDGTLYTGSFSNNIPDGKAYVRYADGSQYDGGIRMGARNGPGEMLYANGNDYKGEWKDNRHDGYGVMSYMLGGRYEGNWKDGKWSGQGKLVYAGGEGRQVVTVDGRDPNRQDRPVLTETYTVKEDQAPIGSHIAREAAHAVPVPPDRGYEQLTAEQQAFVNSWYPALAPGDQPPYPLHGPADFYKLMSKIGGHMNLRGSIHLYVTVDANGKAVGVRAFGLDDPEARKRIAIAAASVVYTPARCAGQPCEMAYPYNLALTLN